ncbi:zonular occludens toxin domain-containing protein [Ruminococcus sp.]|uniref:zonular occludens toxin domain-containing protein n=1 Tax=Ruminococcus sp. TaxID=41978 RepID=UPI0030795CCD
MAISLYSGTPGSYKSYHATEDIIKWLMRGKNVIANFPVDAKKYNSKRKLGKFIFLTNTELTVSFLLDFAKANHSPGLKPQTLVVIDEASIMFNARQFDRKDRMEWVNFFANHRHFNFDVILIAQNDRMLDRQIRGLLEYDIKHRELRNWNLAMALVSIACRGLFHCVEYWYPCKIKTSTQLKRFNKKIADCYDTMALFNFTDDKKSDVQNKTNLKSSFFGKSNIKLDKSKIKEAFNNEQSVKVSEKT